MVPIVEIQENGLYGGFGPHPSVLQIAKPFLFEQEIQNKLVTNGSTEAREAAARIQGVLWIDHVRRALHLPARTYMTAVVYYHKFRLAHIEADYMNADAAAAALFTACKIEDTLKKSRDILCAAYNLKVLLAEQLTPDDVLFEDQSKRLLGIERLMLESSGFDFRNRNPQDWVMKFTRLGRLDRDIVGNKAYKICLDLYKTHAPVKQTSSTMALASVELAARLSDASLTRLNEVIGDETTMANKWGTSRSEVMETLLDILELYTHHRHSTLLGPDYSMEHFMTIRIILNKEAGVTNLPRFSEWIENPALPKINGLAHGSSDASPMSPANPTTAPSTVQHSPIPSESAMSMSPNNFNGERGSLSNRKEGTVRYMLDAERARNEKDVIASYFKEEWEEYEEVIERPAKPVIQNVQNAKAQSSSSQSHDKTTDLLGFEPRTDKSDKEPLTDNDPLNDELNDNNNIDKISKRGEKSANPLSDDGNKSSRSKNNDRGYNGKSHRRENEKVRDRDGEQDTDLFSRQSKKNKIDNRGKDRYDGRGKEYERGQRRDRDVVSERGERDRVDRDDRRSSTNHRERSWERDRERDRDGRHGERESYSRRDGDDRGNRDRDGRDDRDRDRHRGSGQRYREREHRDRNKDLVLDRDRDYRR